MKTKPTPNEPEDEKRDWHESKANCHCTSIVDTTRKGRSSRSDVYIHASLFTLDSVRFLPLQRSEGRDWFKHPEMGVLNMLGGVHFFKFGCERYDPKVLT